MPRKQNTSDKHRKKGAVWKWQHMMRNPPKKNWVETLAAGMFTERLPRSEGLKGKKILKWNQALIVEKT